ncbi:MAG: hypothetical protein J0I41_22040 [Filimonas sp.]|nr:hypothetical protein [Filimonas sp.]
MIKLIVISILFCFSSIVVRARSSDSLVLSNVNYFDKAEVEKEMPKDAHVKKENTKLRVSKCMSFHDKNTDEENSIYTYLGDLDSLQNYKVVKETLYNGEEYLVVDVLNKCKVTSLLGKPHLFGSFIINLNESETTDKKKIIEIWKLSNNGLKKHKDIYYKKMLNVLEIRFLDNKFIMKDTSGRYWQISV